MRGFEKFLSTTVDVADCQILYCVRWVPQAYGAPIPARVEARVRWWLGMVAPPCGQAILSMPDKSFRHSSQ